MRVNFLGGPRDGQLQRLDNPPDHLWVDAPDGRRVLYVRRSLMTYNAGAFEMLPIDASYIPASMTDDEFYARAAKWQPPHDAVH